VTWLRAVTMPRQPEPTPLAESCTTNLCRCLRGSSSPPWCVQRCCVHHTSGLTAALSPGQRDAASVQKSVLAVLWQILETPSPVLCTASQSLLADLFDVAFAKGDTSRLVATVAALAKLACGKTRQPFARVYVDIGAWVSCVQPAQPCHASAELQPRV